MKIKNMKLMLLSLFGLMSVNAMAGDIGPAAGATITRANLAYKVTKAATDAGAAGEVTFLGMVATPDKKDADGPIANQPDGTITIPATVWTLYGDKGNKVNYNVTAIDPAWASYGDGANVKAKLKKLVSEVVEIGTDKKVTSNLIATNFASLEEVVLPAGQTVLAASAFSGCAKLATINLANVANYGDNAMKGTAITSVDLTNAITIGASAFQNCVYVSTLSIPATVTAIGVNAFADMYYMKDAKTIFGLETLTFDAYSDATKGFATIPDAFAGNAKLATVTITSGKATGFDGTFTASLDLANLTLNCVKMNDIAGVFAASKFVSIDIENTALTAISDLDFTNAHQTLTTIKLPAKLAGLDGGKFADCVALTAIDLSGTAVTVIPDNAFQITGAEKDAKGKAIAPALASVKLNVTTTSIGTSAFEGQSALKTVEGMNQAKLATLGNRAFFGAGLETLDLSAATALTTIPTACFGDNKSLTTVKLSDKITAINSAAFTHAVKLSSINLENTKITTLKNIFTSGADDESAPCDALTSLTLPETLTAVDDYALQMTGLTEITIPSSVTTWGWYVLQGCLNLKKFTWNNIDPGINFIGFGTFTGDDKLEEVYFLTQNVGWWGISDSDFEGNDPARLKVYVNAETYNALFANGWTPANTKYATLVAEAETEFEFNEKGKSGEYYYATYYNDLCDTWFPAADFEVFSAVIEASKVVLKPASVDNGYYKVAQWDGTYLHANISGSNSKEAVCVVRSKSQKANVEYKYLGVYESTMPSDNALQITDGTVKPSRLKYQYKFGVKDGVVAFYRITSGTLKKDAVFLESTNPKDRLDIEIEGDATAIQGIQTAIENGAIFNLNGVRVNKPGKGIYIQNGKKYVK